MSSSNGPHSGPSEALPSPEVTPAPTLRAPRDADLTASKAKAAEKAAIKDLFLAREFWLPADLNSSDKSRHGTPVTLLHSVMRLTLGAHGVDWQAYIGGGVVGKIITEALQQRLEGGETTPVRQEPALALLDVNVPGQTGSQRPSKLTVKRKTTLKKGDPRDAIFQVNDQKYRRGLVLNFENISGEGDAAYFRLPFSSPNDSLASPALKRLLAYLKVSDLSKLSFNVDEMTRIPESGTSATGQNSPPASSSPSSALLVQRPFVGQYKSADMLEIYVQPLAAGEVLQTQVKRHGPGPDYLKSLVISGTFSGTICDEVLTTGKEESEMAVHVTRQYSELVNSSFPSSNWELSIPLPSDVDTSKECRGLKRLASGTHVFTIGKKQQEPEVETVEPW